MSFNPHSHARPDERSARNPWSTEPELPPDPAATTHRFDPREALLELDAETRSTMDELAAEIETLRPLVAVDPSAQAPYTSSLRRLAAAEQTAVEIHAARARLNEGTYGFCTSCAEPIPQERLELRPHSLVCVSCCG